MSSIQQLETIVLENSALRLCWRDGSLQAHNRLSGRTRVLSFPAFALRLMGNNLSADSFSLTGTNIHRDSVTFSYEHVDTGLRAEATYWLEGDPDSSGWFRKQVTLQGSAGLPTPERLWVDVQNSPPTPIRRVGYGLRGGPDREEQIGLDTYAAQPGCGYPVYADDWFIGLEHPAAFTVPGERLELYQHPVWDDEGRIESFPAVFGVAKSHAHVAEAFMDYVWHIRLPRLQAPFITITVGWSTLYVGAGEYLDSFETNEAFVKAFRELGLRPDALGLDAGYFERRSLYRHKDDDDKDSRFITFSKKLKEQGLDLALWVSHNGTVGVDMEWIKSQGWKTGEGPGTPYCWGEYVVMMQPDYEEALAQRFERMVGDIGARHLKIDWDNECATSGEFSERYPTPEHVREATIQSFNRIDQRIRSRNQNLITRNGWWPSPWWLSRANHVWLVDSGDCEYASWPSRTQRDRDITHRDASYYQINCRSETPYPLDAFDNHGFADCLNNPFYDEPHTWLDNAVLAFTRGTTYLHVTACPEDFRQWQADMLQQTLDWMRYHAQELGTRDTRMVGGDPAFGAVYGFLHPSRDTAWLVVRNASPEPQSVFLPYAEWLDYAPKTIRQVHPFWQELSPLSALTLLGHEVRLIRLMREPTPDPSPIPGSPFMVQASGRVFEYFFPGNKPLTSKVGPTVHPDMQIHEVTADKTFDGPIEGGWRLQWHVGIPHRFERGELYIKLRGPESALDAVKVCARCDRYRGGTGGHTIPAERIFRNETRGYGTVKWLSPLGPRDRDDYVFKIPDGGYASLTVDITGDSAASLKTEAWITGWESRARQTLKRAAPSMDGPLLPLHPYGFARCLRL